jgi:hypothetical protein
MGTLITWPALVFFTIIDPGQDQPQSSESGDPGLQGRESAPFRGFFRPQCFQNLRMFLEFRT